MMTRIYGEGTIISVVPSGDETVITVHCGAVLRLKTPTRLLLTDKPQDLVPGNTLLFAVDRFSIEGYDVYWIPSFLKVTGPR